MDGGQNVNPPMWALEVGQSLCRACRMLDITGASLHIGIKSVTNAAEVALR